MGVEVLRSANVEVLPINSTDFCIRQMVSFEVSAGNVHVHVEFIHTSKLWLHVQIAWPKPL
jgi:hypothetical protein